MEIATAQSSSVTEALALFAPYLPPRTSLAIEETDGKLIAKYLIRLTYVSAKSGRTLTVMAKGDRLPAEMDDLFKYYISQVVLSPTEVAREFSRVYFLERRARQEAFLYSKNNIRVSEVGISKDKLSYKEYA